MSQSQRSAAVDVLAVGRELLGDLRRSRPFIPPRSTLGSHPASQSRRLIASKWSTQVVRTRMFAPCGGR